MKVTLPNLQAQEPASYRSDGALEIHSVFKTIQGEGPFAGTPAIFVRLAGCNLQCRFCDTEYTSTRRLLNPDDLLNEVEKIIGDDNITLVVITGGEPFRQNIGPFVRRAVYQGTQSNYLDVQIETNGTLFPDDVIRDMENENVTIVCSPKTPKLAQRLVRRIDALKYIIRAGEVSPIDGLPTKTMGLDCEVFRPLGVANHIEYSDIYLQPLDEQDPFKTEENLQACIASCLKHGYSLSLQQHKIAGLE